MNTFVKKVKQAMIRKCRNNKEIPTPNNEVEKKKWIDNQVLIRREHVASRVSSY